ncbi:MAG: DM13 domain-containing protein [Cyanobacteriota bacterium]|nr:DM13 domain-containing protein [Cyanobacteriota bacterium]
MNTRIPAFLGTLALLAVSCNANPPSSQASSPEATPSVEQTESNPTAETSEAATSVAARSGTFVAGEKETEGSASIMTENGQAYLVLDDTFKTADGPDVFVLLHKEMTPESYSESDYVNLGMMEKTSGMQRYTIPAGTNVDDFQSAVIWCRQFNATFGYASLESANSNQ